VQEFEDYERSEIERAPDPQEMRAVEVFRKFFEQHREEVFTSRQLEVQHEREFFHWVSNRAIRDLIGEGLLRTETRALAFGGSVKLIWHRKYRYPKRDAGRVVGLVDEYSAPNIGGALGLHGELMVLEGFAREGFVMRGRETRAYGGMDWTESDHDLDFIFARDDVAYGVEVKNTLAYMDHQEMLAKIAMCAHLGLRPVIVARMLPKSWVEELRQEGGFGLILKFQLYPLAHRDLARRVREELGLPVDAPRALTSGTMARFVAWHERQRSSL
jgi:hypothetical protein